MSELYLLIFYIRRKKLPSGEIFEKIRYWDLALKKEADEENFDSDFMVSADKCKSNLIY